MSSTPRERSAPEAAGDETQSEASSAAAADGDIFRKEALEHYASGQSEGDLLRISPAWTRWAYWILVGALAAGLLYVTFGSVTEYATGAAVIRVEGRTDVPATAAGVVDAVEVQPGQRVAQGQVLVRFHDRQEAAELERIEREYNLQQLKSLRDPGDATARQALMTLGAQRDLARTRREERIVKAPYSGTVTDIRIRPGQNLAPGESALTMRAENARFYVVAMLPGQYRPMLKPKETTLRLELSGYRYAYQELTIESVGDEVVGPAEVRRYLGQEIADIVPVPGPVVLVQARLPNASFVAEGRTLDYYDGMQGKAEARVRTQSILVALVPGLKALFEY